MSELIVFCGPSLPHDEAQTLAGKRARILPPARQGDVYRVLSVRPRAIALIDGVFESVPSVWHRELIAALEAGVRVFGASSMGALRAAELEPYGMVGVGQVFEQVRAGAISDDAEVALLHADQEHGFRPLTVPLVTALHALGAARAEGLISEREAQALSAGARALHYQQRTWPELLGSLPEARRPALLSWLRTAAPDPKRADARACIREARAAPPGTPRPIRIAPSHARVRQLLQSESRLGDRAVAGEEVLESLASRDEAQALVEAGLRRLVLGAYGRSLGFEISDAAREEAIDAWLQQAGVPRSRIAELGLDEGQLARIGEALALEQQVLEHAARVLPDGPSALEGLALEARASGAWRRVVRERLGRR